MWIKEIIVDGFKSYANRTVISGWDPSFNAITGLNGSGKSNILDSICFVLGISNLSQVRVQNLQELVYKQGQARVTKASVTIVFDNRDAKQSPVGYEQYDEITVTRQIVIGGRNKYLINGVSAQLSKVQNLFHSVQLNVNNPHFLIMQGRITKVTHMKPPEILAMIEEAAGTRMYENKKRTALKTIEKKETKVQEINKIIEEDLTPTLEKLRKERSSYMEWSANNTEIERLTRFTVAHDFFEAQQLLETSKGDLRALEAQQESLKQKSKEIQEEIQKTGEELSELMKGKEKQMQSRFKELEKQVADLEIDLVKETTVWEHQKANIEAEKKTESQMTVAIKELRANIKAKQQQAAVLNAKCDEVSHAHKELEEQVERLQGQLLGIGMSEKDKDKEQGTLTSQLMNAQREATKAESDHKATLIKVQHLKSGLESKKKQLKSMEKDNTGMQQTFSQKQRELQATDEKLRGLKHDPEASSKCALDVQALEEQISVIREEHDRLSARLASTLQLDYRAPPGFDRANIKGFVAELVKVRDSKTTVALEVTAGGKLYNVVVGSQEAGKQLLDKGELRKRITIIPLDKIASKSIDAKLLNFAESIVGKENVCTALSLVGYSEEVEPAMRFVFGNTFVCSDSRAAEQVTFHPNIRTRSVTYQGDLFDPQGTLTGGSRGENENVLAAVEAARNARSKLAALDQQLATARSRLEQLKQADQLAQEALSKKELLSHELQLLSNRLKQSSFAQCTAEVEDLEAQLGAEERLAVERARAREDWVRKGAELEVAVRDFDTQRATKLKQLEKDAAHAKTALANSLKNYKAVTQEQETMGLEIAEMEREAESQQQQREKLLARIAQLQEEASSSEAAVSSRKRARDAARAGLDQERAKIDQTDKNIQALNKTKAKLSKELSESELEVKKIAHKISRMTSDAATAGQRIQVMLKKFEWIVAEKQFFGKSKTEYDFNAYSPQQAQARLAEVVEAQERLSKKVNKKVMGMFDKAEQEYQELMKKRSIVERDKKKIEEVIIELDRKKNQALDTTWKKVTVDFGSIFSALLPGTKAKLEPPEGQTVLDGLEVRVAFNDVWRDSLSELSGGQRSLLALSLILAMLLFKPAPMYILDEIDAALDLSHTQNIGTMLKTHFPMSQFIVVSLKEGMFNNANVIFRTKFVDGVSCVTRTVNKTTSSKDRDREKDKDRRA